MKIRTLALVLGSAVVVAGAGVGVTACSSSSSPDNGGGNDAGNGGHDATSGGNDSGNTMGNDSGNTMGNDSGNTMGNDGGTTTADCGSSPSLHVDEAGSIYCGFNGDAGALTCAKGQECCIGNKDPQTKAFDDQACVTFGSACNNPTATDASAGGIPMQCAQIADCTANGVQNAACCMQGGEAPAMPAGCSYYKTSDGNSITCEAANGAPPDAGAPSCAPGELQVCSSNADCPAGKTCVASKWKIIQIGLCQEADGGF